MVAALLLALALAALALASACAALARGRAALAVGRAALARGRAALARSLGSAGAGNEEHVALVEQRIEVAGAEQRVEAAGVERVGAAGIQDIVVRLEEVAEVALVQVRSGSAGQTREAGLTGAECR